MLVAAALVPDTVLLLPGAAGRGPDEPALVALRAGAASAVDQVVTGAQRVVVVAPGRRTRSLAGPVVVGATAAGVPDHLLRTPVGRAVLAPAPGAPPPATGSPGAGAVVGLRLALDARVPAARLHVVEVAQDEAQVLRGVGADLCAHGPVALVVVGSGAARHGDGAPLARDPRAGVTDARLLAAARSGGAACRDALATADRTLSAELGVTGWAPWQVLVGALDAAGAQELASPRVEHAAVWRGAAHAAVAWRVAS